MTPLEVSSDSVAVVALEPEPHLYAQFDGLIDTVRESNNQDVVLDFCAVGMLTTSGISRLMRLRSLLDGSRRLILCQVRTAVKGVFAVIGLDRVLEFAERQDDALSAIPPISQWCNAQSRGRFRGPESLLVRSVFLGKRFPAKARKYVTSTIDI